MDSDSPSLIDLARRQGAEGQGFAISNLRQAEEAAREAARHERVGVFQPRPGLGDLIWHLPLIREIAAGSARGTVTLITKPSTQADQLLAGDPAIERIVWFDRNPREHERRAGAHDGLFGFPRLIADLRRLRLDHCVLLHHGDSLAAAMRLAGIANRYGYGTSKAQRRFLNRGPFLPDIAPFTEAFDQATAYAGAMGLEDLPEPWVAVDEAAAARVAARIAPLAHPCAVLGVGCAGADRQWGARNWAALAMALRYRGYGSVKLLAAAHEFALVEAILAETGENHVSTAIGWPLPEVTALLAQAAVFIGNDSGLMNLRAAVRRPAVGLFGASGPLRHSKLILPVVPAGGPRAGMDQISLAQVLAATPHP